MDRKEETYFTAPQDAGMTLRQYLYVIRRRKAVLLGFFASAMMLGFVLTFFQTPIYRATATVIIEPDVPNAVDFAESQQNPALQKNYFETQYEIMLSYGIVSRAFERSGLSASPAYAGLSNPVEAFREVISVLPVRNTQLVKVSYEGPDPEEAARVVNILSKVYIERNLEDRRTASRDAFTWLSEQLALVEASVEKSEIELLRYKEQEDIVSLEKRQTLVEEKLSAQNENYEKAATARVELETTLKELEKLRGNPEMAESLPKILENPLVQSLKKELSNLDIQLAKLSTKYKPMHPEIIRIESQIRKIRERLASEVDKIAKSIEIEYRIASARESSIRAGLDDLKRQSMRLSQQAVQYGVLKREAESNAQMYEVLLNRMKETDIGGNINVNNIRLIEEARPPEDPIRPRRAMNMALAVLAGILGGIGLCFGVEHFDDTFKNEDDVRMYLDMGLLGVVPKEKSPEAAGSEDPEALVRSYRDIKTAVGFYGQEHLLKSLIVTSSVRAEGKTTTSLYLAKAFAQSGQKVLLMDVDLYHPRLGKLLGLSAEAGLTDYFLRGKGTGDIIKNTRTPNLSVMPAGLIPPNPEELFASDKMKALLEDMKEKYDLVILDSPPLSVSLDVAVLASRVDGIALVVKADETSIAVASKMAGRLRMLRGNTLGAILTSADVSHGDTGAYYQYKRYGYGREAN